MSGFLGALGALFFLPRDRRGAPGRIRALGAVAILMLVGAPIRGTQTPVPLATVPSDTLESDPLIAIEMAAPPSGLRVFRLPHGTSPLVALRLFVPIEEGAAEGGAGWILARLAENRIAEASRRLGAEILVARSPRGISYAVSGPVSDFDYLAYLLRVATGPPEPAGVTEARRELEDALTRLLETGPGQVELELRTRIPDALPTYGTPAAVRALSPARVMDVWRRSHRSDRMTLLVHGNVARPLLLASTVGMGASEATPPVRPDAISAPPTTLPRIDILRRFGGRAWQAPESLDPRMAVLVRLAADRIRTEPGEFEASVQLWETGGGSILAVTGAAFPNRFADLEDALDGLPDRLRDSLSPGSIDRVAATLAGAVLTEAGTPMGRVTVVGRFLDATGSPAGARAYMDRLDAMDMEAVLSLLDRLGPPATVTVR